MCLGEEKKKMVIFYFELWKEKVQYQIPDHSIALANVDDLARYF